MSKCIQTGQSDAVHETEYFPRLQNQCCHIGSCTAGTGTAAGWKPTGVSLFKHVHTQDSAVGLGSSSSMLSLFLSLDWRFSGFRGKSSTKEKEEEAVKELLVLLCTFYQSVHSFLSFQHWVRIRVDHLGVERENESPAFIVFMPQILLYPCSLLFSFGQRPFGDLYNLINVQRLTCWYIKTGSSRFPVAHQRYIKESISNSGLINTL